MFENFQIVNRNSINAAIIYQSDEKFIIQCSSSILSSIEDFVTRMYPVLSEITDKLKLVGQPSIIITRLMFGNRENGSFPKSLAEFDAARVLDSIKFKSNDTDTGHYIIEVHSTNYYNPSRLWEIPTIHNDQVSGYNSDESL